MLHWSRRLLVVAGAVSLTGCLWGPGKFQSDLTVRKDSSFILNYRGELVLQTPPETDVKSEPWNADFARCYRDREPEIVNPSAAAAIGQVDKDATGEAQPEARRACTKAEIAKLKTQYEKEQADAADKKRKDNEGLAKAFGLPGLDDASNRAFAAKMMKYAGWRSVTYRGKGVFDVDYHFEGKATQDFLFPALPDNNLVIPFIAIRRRADGSVLVTAPAFTGGAGPMAGAAGPGMPKGDGPVWRAEGRFTVITDGEILTNNSEDGATPHAIGRQVRWDVNSGSTKIPETLIKLQ